jgi:hypothetical protein
MKPIIDYIKILSEKPDTFCHLPESTLPADQIETLNKIPRLVVGEICGIESIEAMRYALDRKSVDAFLPTIVYTGTEYGYWKTVLSKLNTFKKTVEKLLRIYCLDPVLLGAPALWWALNGRFIHELNNRFKFYSPCLGCRLYCYAVRVPLCKKLACTEIVSGRIHTKNEPVTINTSAEVMYYSRTLLSNFGIKMSKTMTAEENKDCTASKAGRASSEEDNSCTCCVFKDNYQQLRGCLHEMPDNKKYFEQFALPATAKIVSMVLAGKKIDYLQEVTDTLLPGEKLKTKKLFIR